LFLIFEERKVRRIKNMKKIAALFVNLCLAFVMVVTLTACGSSKEFKDIQEYLDAQKDQIDAAIKQQEGLGMTMEVKADGDTLVYRYVYADEMPINDETTAYFDQKLEETKEQFTAVIDEMKELIDVENPKVKLLYENPDGSVVYEHTYE